MPYRRHGEALELPTADGPLRIRIEPDVIELELASRSVRIANRLAEVRAGGRTETIPITGRVVIARNVPREDLAIWVEDHDGEPAMRRLFGAAPVSLLAPDHLTCLRQLEEASRRLRDATSSTSAGLVRAVELGAGRDHERLLLVELADRHLVFACRLFRGQARLVLAAFADGRISFLHHARDIVVHSEIAVSVHGECLRFSDRGDGELARVSMPWAAPDDRAELARRINRLVGTAPSHRSE